MTTQPVPCGKCGNQAPAGTRFCPNCGVSLGEAAAQPVISTPPPVAVVPPATPVSAAAGPPPYLTPTILCSHCNAEFSTELKFCPRCGAAAGQGTYTAPLSQNTRTASAVQNTSAAPVAQNPYTAAPQVQRVVPPAVAPGAICGGCGSPVAPDGAFCVRCGTPVGVAPVPGPRNAYADPSPASGSATATAAAVGQHEYAGFWIRVLADLIDTVVLILIAVLFAWTNVFDLVISFILMTLYGAITESSVHQSSLGKRAMGLKVTDLEGKRISFGKALGRNLFKGISSFIPIVFLIVAVTPKKQGAHDLLVGTQVWKTM
jgi:uncharacterized RDD family membrane protein YckC/predicted amidophosphoribosyltransferase